MDPAAISEGAPENLRSRPQLENSADAGPELKRFLGIGYRLVAHHTSHNCHGAERPAAPLRPNRRHFRRVRLPDLRSDDQPFNVTADNRNQLARRARMTALKQVYRVLIELPRRGFTVTIMSIAASSNIAPRRLV